MYWSVTSIIKIQRQSGATLHVFMLYATTSSFKCTRASEESQLISSAVCQQRGPDASQAAARGANERRREHLPFKTGEMLCLCSTLRVFVLFSFLPPTPRTKRKGRHCRFKRFSLNWTRCQRILFFKEESHWCVDQINRLPVRGVHGGRWDLHNYEESHS